jgi:hypothetical protein
MRGRTTGLAVCAGAVLSGVLCFWGQGAAAPPIAPSPFGDLAVLQNEMIAQLKEVNAQLKDLNAYLHSGNVRVTILLPESSGPPAKEKETEK